LGSTPRELSEGAKKVNGAASAGASPTIDSMEDSGSRDGAEQLERGAIVRHCRARRRFRMSAPSFKHRKEHDRQNENDQQQDE
jgi:hypothetical protein